MFGMFKKKSSEPNGPDFSSIDSQAKVEQAFRQGDLEKLYLIPLEFGGEDIPQNVLYVPIGTADIKSDIDNNIIGPLAAEGKISQYRAEPEYQGKSFVPIAITITVSDPGHFTSTINLWGEALKRNKV